MLELSSNMINFFSSLVYRFSFFLRMSKPVIVKEFADYFAKEGFEADSKNPYNREDGKIQYRFIKKDEKGHNIAECWLNEKEGVLGAFE